MSVNVLDLYDSEFELIELDEDDFDEIVVVDLGPAAIIPLDASFNTVHLLSQALSIGNGELRINRLFGEYIVATLNSNVTVFEILNWPPAPFLGRIMLEVISQPGDYSIDWPPWIKWSYNRIPDLSASGKDKFLFTSTDSGVTVDGQIVGQDYPL